MKKVDIPQEENEALNGQKKVMYASNDEGKFQRFKYGSKVEEYATKVALSEYEELKREALQKIQEGALKLSSKERALLAKCLIESLDTAEESEIEQLWLDEAERRLAAHAKGAIPARPASEVFAEAYERIK